MDGKFRRPTFHAAMSGLPPVQASAPPLSDGGLLSAGNIEVSILGATPIFAWRDATIFSLIVERALGTNTDPVWAIRSSIGFSSCVAYGVIPAFAQEEESAQLLSSGVRYFVSIYGEYPNYGVQEFMLD